MNQEEMKRRTKQFALRIILLRSGTSVGANYRAACRAKSNADFISKMGTVEEETDESLYWMELLIEAEIVKSDSLESLMDEADELLAITVSSIKTARRKRNK
jgi:four helix bundle protein